MQPFGYLPHQSPSTVGKNIINYNKYMLNYDMTWSIPSITDGDAHIICRSWIANKCDHCNLYIPPAIMDLCFLFYGPSDSLRTIRNCSNGYVIRSQIHKIGCFKWFMEFYPNGYSQKKEGCANWYLCLASLSPQISKLRVRYNINFVESDIHRISIKEFNAKKLSTGWRSKTIKTEDIVSLDTLTFKLSLLSVEIFDLENKDITTEYESKHLNAIGYNKNNDNCNMNGYNKYCNTMEQFTWKITDDATIQSILSSQCGTVFYSPIFKAHSFKWYLKFYPNGVKESYKGYSDLHLQIVALPPNICSISVQLKLLLFETNTFRSVTRQFTKKNCGVGWPGNSLHINEILGLKRFTFRVELTLIDMFDANGKEIISDQNERENKENDNDYMLSDLYEWKISDANAIKNMRNLHKGQAVLSSVFGVHSFRFNLKIYPNGWKERDIGQIGWGVQLASLSPCIAQIVYECKILLVELDEECRNIVAITHENIVTDWSFGKFIKFHTESLQSSMNSLTFQLQINILDIYNENGQKIALETFVEPNDVIKVNKSISWNKYQTFEWKIDGIEAIKQMKLCANETEFKSDVFEMHSFKWHLKFFPNGSQEKLSGNTELYLHLSGMFASDDGDGNSGNKVCECDDRNIATIAIKFEMILLETNTKYCNATQFNKTHTRVGIGWRRSKLLTEDIQNLDSLTFCIHISLVEVWDNNGNLVL